MKIQHNLLAMNANRNIKINTGISAKTTEKLSSGYKINRAADDAAGLSISEKMRKMIRGLDRASQNCQDGISMVQTAEGALSEVHAMLQRMNELAVQSANGTNSASDREALQQEFAQIQDEIDRVSTTTKFNELKLFTGEVNGAGGTGGTGGTNNNGGTTLAVTCGDFTVTGGVKDVDFSYDEVHGVLHVFTDKDITIKGTGAVSGDVISIEPGINANLTLENVNIDVSHKEWACAFNINDTASLNLTLTGTNILKSGNFVAGLQVNNGASLVITEQSTGSLTATSGNYAAGIGGGFIGDSGDITINGGEVTATGGECAAGIGGGSGGNGGNITIAGGEVTATGGDYGAGIGGGELGTGGNITISGGDITATGGADSAGIGGGVEGSAGNITITGGIITATGDNTVAIGRGFNGDESGNIIIGGGVINGATVGNPTQSPVTCGAFTVSGGTEGIDFSYDSDAGTLTVLSDKAITIEGTGAVTTDKILIQDGVNANVTLENVNIDVSANTDESAMKVDGTASLNLTLTGTNTLKSSDFVAGLQVARGASLVITEQSTGELIAIGGESGAGIGGSFDRSGGENGSGGEIIINGGIVEATGGDSGAGIGGAYMGGGGTITINDGDVTATGVGGGAGIGGGMLGNGGNITIIGGDVTAAGGESGAGIGGGFTKDGGNITISGGIIEATGGDSGAGIGGGRNGNGGNITISGGIIEATGGDGGSAIGGGEFSDNEGNISISGGVINGATVGNPTTRSIQTMSLYGMERASSVTVGGFEVSGGTEGVDFSYSNEYSHGILTIKDGANLTITGTNTETMIYIEDGANVNITLDNVNIDMSNSTPPSAMLVGNNASLNLTLTGNNTLKSGSECAGLHIQDGASVVIAEASTGSLTATGGANAAGIGGGSHEDGGNITINGGTIIAIGGTNAAGMGGGIEGDGGNVVISGGDVQAKGGTNGAGIGGGGQGGSGGNVTITGGEVKATGGVNGDGIGGGDQGAGGTFSTGVNGNATIKAEGGTNGDAIADTSDLGNWSGWVNDQIYGNPTPPATGGGGNTGTGGTTTGGTGSNAIWIQAGADAGVGLNIEIGAMDTKVLGIEKDTVNILTETDSDNAITAVGEAIQKLSEQRSRLGAYQNRLEHTIANLDNVVENTSAAESRIRDADMAEEMVDHAKNNILMQAVQTMLSQANSQPEAVLQLLQ